MNATIINTLIAANNASVTVLEDNAGGLALRVTKGATVVASSGWEHQPGALTEALKGLAAGEDPADWDIPGQDILTDADWAALVETATVVLDMRGLGPRMGIAAKAELGWLALTGAASIDAVADLGRECAVESIAQGWARGLDSLSRDEQSVDVLLEGDWEALRRLLGREPTEDETAVFVNAAAEVFYDVLQSTSWWLEKRATGWWLIPDK